MPDKQRIPTDFQDHDLPIQNNPNNWSDADRWLPKTDWSRDGIIANDD